MGTPAPASERSNAGTGRDFCTLAALAVGVALLDHIDRLHASDPVPEA